MQLTHYTELLDPVWQELCSRPCAQNRTDSPATDLACQRCHIRAGVEFKLWLASMSDPLSDTTARQTVRSACLLSVHLTKLTNGGAIPLEVRFALCLLVFLALR